MSANSQCPVCGGPLEALYSELGWSADLLNPPGMRLRLFAKFLGPLPVAPQRLARAQRLARVVGWLCLESGMQVGTQGGAWVHFRSESNGDD